MSPKMMILVACLKLMSSWRCVGLPKNIDEILFKVEILYTKITIY
jgi:hypothetical protein